MPTTPAKPDLFGRPPLAMTEGGNPVWLVIPSTKRATTGTTWSVYPEAIVYVHRSEASAYAERDPATHAIDRGLTPIRNAILDAAPVGSWVVMLDDDITKVGHFTNAHRVVHWSGREHLDRYLALMSYAEAGGYDLCGEAPTKNPLNYRHGYSTTTFVEGHCMMCRVTEMRFDEATVVKEDYDYLLQLVAAGRGTLRADYLFSAYNYHTKAGGCFDYRTLAVERAAFEYMMRKWGDWLTPKTGKANTPYEFTINRAAIARDLGRA